MEHLKTFFAKKDKRELVDLLAECSRADFNFWLLIRDFENKKIAAAEKALNAFLKANKKAPSRS